MRQGRIALHNANEHDNMDYYVYFAKGYLWGYNVRLGTVLNESCYFIPSVGPKVVYRPAGTKGFDTDNQRHFHGCAYDYSAAVAMGIDISDGWGRGDGESNQGFTYEASGGVGEGWCGGGDGGSGETSEYRGDG